MHYKDHHAPQPIWYLEKSRYVSHEIWDNVAPSRIDRIHVDLDIGPYWLGEHAAENEGDDDRLCYPNTRFVFDTGASTSMIRGEIAQKAMAFCKPEGATKCWIANAESIIAPTGWLSIRILKRWHPIKFCFWTPTILGKHVEQKVILGMDAVLEHHLITISKEQVDLFRRPSYGVDWAKRPILT